MNVETLLDRTFFDSYMYPYRLKAIQCKGEHRVGMGTFYVNKRHWNPVKKNFSMKCFLEEVGHFDEDVKRGATLIRLTQIPLVCI